MTQSISRRASKRIATFTSNIHLTNSKESYGPEDKYTINPPHISPCPSISAPAPRCRLLHFSELLDPEELIREDSIRAKTPVPVPTSDKSSGAQSPKRCKQAVMEVKRLIVHSPSGNALDPQTFAKRPDRPLTIAERQQRIREEIWKKEGEMMRKEKEEQKKKGTAGKKARRGRWKGWLGIGCAPN